ncbi:hypothetical protein ACQ86N_42045 [Puia sp. P3]|uniref:hypothetical protein n=1 Tax=Puia sp. P3 TaxID=3423952 RepID=UPI003D66D7DB
MGPSDEDVNYAFTTRNRQTSISGFWMDATEITNNEYRQFTNWVRDSIAATLMQYGKDVDGRFQIDWKKPRRSNGATRLPLKRSTRWWSLPTTASSAKRRSTPAS